MDEEDDVEDVRAAAEMPEEEDDADDDCFWAALSASKAEDLFKILVERVVNFFCA